MQNDQVNEKETISEVTTQIIKEELKDLKDG